jgi:hypothetical protein
MAKINKFEPYHGPVLSRIIKACGDLNIVIRPAFDINSYFLSTSKYSDEESLNIGIFIKYAASRLTPWRFTIYKAEQEELQIFQDECKAAFLILVCGRDGIACLNFNQMKEVLDDNFKDKEWISASRRLNEHYTIKGSDGKLTRKIGPGVFPSKIISELNKIEKTKKKNFLNW